MGTIEVPIFYGDDPERWVSWIDAFGSAQGFSDFEYIQFAYGFVEDDALTWFNGENSRSPFSSWDELKLRLFQRFSKVKEKNEWSHERWMSCMERIDKLLRSGLAKQDLGGEEKENTSLGCEEELSGFVDTERKETHKQEEEKQSDAEMDKNACHMFDGMTLGGKRKMKKRKKKRWKSEEKHQREEEKQRYNFKDSYACQMLDKRPRIRKRATRKKKKGQFTNAKRSKYKFGNVNPMTCQTQAQNNFRKQNNKNLMKRCKLGNCLASYNHQVVGKKFMWRFTKKKKKRTRLKESGRKGVKQLAAKMTRDTNRECLKRPITGQGVRRKREVRYGQFRRIKRCSRVKFCWLVLNELLLWEIRVKKKKKNMVCTKSCRCKYKCTTKLDQKKLFRILKTNKFRGHKTWTVRKSHRLKRFCHRFKWSKQAYSFCCSIYHIKNMSSDQMAGKIWSCIPKEKIKPKLKTIRNVVLLLEERNHQIHQVIIDVPIAGVETAKKKMFWTSGKRRRFRHKHKKKKNTKEWMNENCSWLYRMWLLRFTQRKKKKQKIHGSPKAIVEDNGSWHGCHVVDKLVLFKNFCSFLTHIPEHQNRKHASRLVAFNRNDVGAGMNLRDTTSQAKTDGISDINCPGIMGQRMLEQR